MKAAIVKLETYLDILLNNEPIHRSEGRTKQADYELQCIKEVNQALDVLNSRNDDSLYPSEQFD